MSLNEHIVIKEEVNERIDKLLSQLLTKHSRTEIQSWINEQFVKVNNKEIKPNYRCEIGDRVVWSIPEEKELKIIPEKISLSIVYEDDDLLVVNKQAGMVVHPSIDHQSGTLVHALLYHTDQLSKVGGEHRPGIVHRLDKDTGGLLVVAKKDDIHNALTNQFKNNKVERKYDAIVHGVIDHQSGLIDAPIGRDPNNRLRMAVVDSGKKALTHFQVLQIYENHSYIQCQLETGRTHQIRVHMDYINNPILGDPTYGGRKVIGKGGQALYAKSLGFIHPRTNEWQHFEIDAPIYFKEMLQEIKDKR